MTRRLLIPIQRTQPLERQRQMVYGVFVFLVFLRSTFGFTYLATCRANLDVAFVLTVSWVDTYHLLLPSQSDLDRLDQIY